MLTGGISQASRDLSLAVSFRRAILQLESHTESEASDPFLVLASVASAEDVLSIL